MGFFSFFNPPKPRQFHYEPRYYKPEEEPGKDGKEPTDREKLERKLEQSWKVGRSATQKRRSMFSIVMIAGVTLLIVLFIGSKSFTRLFEISGNRPKSEFTEAEQPSYRIYRDSTGRCDTIYQGEIGGIFSRRIDSLAILAFRGEFGDDEQMKEKLGEEYEIVRMKMDQLNEEYERATEPVQ